MIEENNSKNLKPKLQLAIQAVSKGMELKDALISLGYSDNPKSIDNQIFRLNQNPQFCRELEEAKQKQINNRLISGQIDKEKIMVEFYQLYQQLKDDDPANAIKCLNSLKDIVLPRNNDNPKQIKHEHTISFENILNDMRKGIENKPMISIN